MTKSLFILFSSHNESIEKPPHYDLGVVFGVFLISPSMRSLCTEHPERSYFLPTHWFRARLPFSTASTSVLSQKKLYTFCHSGLDPESSVFDLDSRFRGDDDSHHHCKEVLETLHERAKQRELLSVRLSALSVSLFGQAS